MRQLRTTGFALIGLSLAACGYDNGPDVDTYNANPNNQVYPTADIDADAILGNVVPGALGMYIEYATGGTWTVMFTCDYPAYTCQWSINAQTLDGSAITGVNTQQLDPSNPGEDLVDHPRPDLLTYDGITTSEVDQFSFQAGAGLPVGFDVGLQNEATPNRYVFWIGDGGVNRGISSPSFNLYPHPVQ